MATPHAGKRRSLPYAHLLGGLLGRVSAKAQIDDTEPPDEPQDEDQQGTIDDLEDELNAEHHEFPKPDEAGAQDEETDDDETDGDEEPAGRRARRAQDDEETEETAAVRRAGYRAGREAERARCRAIFASAAAGVRPDLAAYLACDTGMSSAAAIAMLETTVQGTSAMTQGSSHARSGLGARMAVTPIPNPGTGGGGPLTLAQQIVAANNKRLGIKSQ